MAPRTYLRKQAPVRIPQSAMAVNALLAANMVKKCHSKGQHIIDSHLKSNDSVHLNKTDDTFTRLANGLNYNSVCFTTDKVPYQSLALSRSTVDLPSHLTESEKTSSNFTTNSNSFSGLNDGCINRSLILIQSWEQPKNFITQRKSKRKVNGTFKAKSKNSSRMSASNNLSQPLRNKTGSRISKRFCELYCNGITAQEREKAALLSDSNKSNIEEFEKNVKPMRDAEVGVHRHGQEEATNLSMRHIHSIRLNATHIDNLLDISRLRNSSIHNESCFPFVNNSICDNNNFMSSTPLHKQSDNRIKEIIPFASPIVIRRTRAKTYKLFDKTDNNSNSIKTTDIILSKEAPTVTHQTRSRSKYLPKIGEANKTTPKGSPVQRQSSSKRKQETEEPLASKLPTESPVKTRSRSRATQIGIEKEFAELSSIYPIESDRRLRSRSYPSQQDPYELLWNRKHQSLSAKGALYIQNPESSKTSPVTRGRSRTCPTKREPQSDETIEKISTTSAAAAGRRRTRSAKVAAENIQGILSNTLPSALVSKRVLRPRSCPPKKGPHEVTTTNRKRYSHISKVVSETEAFPKKRGRPRSCPSKHKSDEISASDRKQYTRLSKHDPEIEKKPKQRGRPRSCTSNQDSCHKLATADRERYSRTSKVDPETENLPKKRGRPQSCLAKQERNEISTTFYKSTNIKRFSRISKVESSNEELVDRNGYRDLQSPVSMRTRSRSQSYSVKRGTDYDDSLPIRSFSAIENEHAESNKSNVVFMTPSCRVLRRRKTIAEESYRTDIKYMNITEGIPHILTPSHRVTRRRKPVPEDTFNTTNNISTIPTKAPDVNLNTTPALNISINNNTIPSTITINSTIGNSVKQERMGIGTTDADRNYTIGDVPSLNNNNLEYVHATNKSLITIDSSIENSIKLERVVQDEEICNNISPISRNISSLGHQMNNFSPNSRGIVNSTRDKHGNNHGCSLTNGVLESRVNDMKHSPISVVSSGNNNIESQCLYIDNEKQPAEFLIPAVPVVRKTYRPGKKYRRSILECIETADECPNIINISSTTTSEQHRRSSVRLVPVRHQQSPFGANKFETDDPRSPKRLLLRRSSIYVGNDSLEQQPQLHASARSGGILDESVDEEVAANTAREIVLQNCDQDKPEPWETFYPDRALEHCSKIGEGVYGEVFMIRNARRTTSVLKVIPIEGDRIVNGEHQKKFQDILSEIIIAKKLSSLCTPGFNRLEAAHLVCGAYPAKLLDLWHLYNESKCSENDCPDQFETETQLYLILQLEHGGKDLESYEFKNSMQAYSIFMQLAYSLAQAEHHFAFEHRDLHWGNVLISQCPDTVTLIYTVPDGTQCTVTTHGVRCNIIDFTLSRMTVPRGEGIVSVEGRGEGEDLDDWVLYNDLKEDGGLFEGEGDVQFDVYRQMRSETEDNWRQFCPKTNVYWLKYILQKMLTDIEYSEPHTRSHKSYLNKLRRCRSRMHMFSSCASVVKFLS